MNFKAINYKVHTILDSLGKMTNHDISTECWEKVIQLHPDLGKGKVSGFKFDDGLSMLLFDCTFKEDWYLNFDSTTTPPLMLSFCTEGEIWHSLQNDGIRYELKPLQSSLSTTARNTSQSFIFEKNKKLLLALVLINRKVYADKVQNNFKGMNPKIVAAFRDVDGQSTFLHQSSTTIAVSRTIRKILSDENCGFIRSVFVEARVLDLIGMQISQIEDDFSLLGRRVKLKQYDIDKIKSARDILVEDLKNPPTIEMLARKTGINQQKLKSGFKLIYQSTINKYLTQERMQQASVKILNGATIGEAAKEVGYSNVSHFAKKFKDYCGLLPKDYRKNIKKRVGLTANA